jgi:hypothetical protein
MRPADPEIQTTPAAQEMGGTDPMRTPGAAGAVAIVLLAVVATGCSGDDEDSSFVPRGEVGSPTPGNPEIVDTVVNVETGRWGHDAMIPTLVEYLEARQSSMRERRIVPDLVETATFQWIQQQRLVIADAEDRGWTVPAAARMRVVGVEPGNADAVVRVCMWGPSVDFIDAKSGEPVRSQQRQWYPFDVKMVLAGDRWYVSAAAEGAFACEVDEG